MPLLMLGMLAPQINSVDPLAFPLLSQDVRNALLGANREVCALRLGVAGH